MIDSAFRAGDDVFVVDPDGISYSIVCVVNVHTGDDGRIVYRLSNLSDVRHDELFATPLAALDECERRLGALVDRTVLDENGCV